MKYKQTLQMMQAQIDEIKELTIKFEKFDRFRAIELDLLLDKLRNVYDVALVLSDAVILEPESNETTGATAGMNIDPDEVEAANKDESREIEFEIENGQDSDEVEGIKKDIDNDKSSVADRFKADTPTLNEEILGNKVNADVSSAISSQPISSITGALGLNEKFELINELFNGNQELFTQTMNTINEASSFVEAYTYLEEQHNWDMDNPYVQRILELIRRKLIVRRDER